MNRLKDQRPGYPIGTQVEMIRPYGHLRPGVTGEAVEHYDDGLVLFRFGDERHTFPLDDLEYFLQIVTSVTAAQVVAPPEQHCKHKQADGCCGHPKNRTPECHEEACPL